MFLTDCRQGWKTSGNGYFVYKASTDFNTTNKLSISGKFSTKPGSMLKNVLVAVEDANGELKFQVSANKGKKYKIKCFEYLSNDINQEMKLLSENYHRIEMALLSIFSQSYNQFSYSLKTLDFSNLISS